MKFLTPYGQRVCTVLWMERSCPRLRSSRPTVAASPGTRIDRQSPCGRIALSALRSDFALAATHSLVCRCRQNRT